MATMLRKFGFKKAEHRESEARLKLQKELFAYNQCVQHGFPNKPSALAYDPKLKLLAIGTKSGSLRVLGAPGVEFSAQHKDDVSVTKLYFLPDQARLISLCSDNSIHLWEINVKDSGASILEEVRSFSMEASKLKTISACCLTANCEQLLMGTEGGDIHLLDVNTFKLSEQIIYQGVIMQNVPDDFKVNPGAIEAVEQHPTDPNKFLIGYNRGLIVLWDIQESNADQTYNATQQLESVSWHRDGTQFMSAHADGSYIIWSTADSTKPKEQANTPYGPFPCKAITKIQWKSTKADPYIIFSGGMPRPSYADRHTVSVMQGGKQVVFDFTSRVIDFFTLSTADDVDADKAEYDDPHSLIVLAEEEIVAIDLQSDNWPTFKQPYLCSLHSSAITCAHHVSNVPDQLWTKLVDAGNAQTSNHSTRDWPIWGGTNKTQTIGTKDLLLTGHEDGTIRFWDASNTAMSLLYKLSTAAVFGCDFGQSDQANTEGEEEWPPFRKVGTFDPYSDDPRLGIQKISMCPISETLVVGGTAGQVVVMQFEREEREHEVKAVTVNIVGDRDNFIWKGHEALKVKEGDGKYAAGFQPISVMQLYPPAACTALAMQAEWQLVAAGTAHGFGLFDYAKKKKVPTATLR